MQCKREIKKPKKIQFFKGPTHLIQKALSDKQFL